MTFSKEKERQLFLWRKCKHKETAPHLGAASLFCLKLDLLNGLSKSE